MRPRKPMYRVVISSWGTVGGGQHTQAPGATGRGSEQTSQQLQQLPDSSASTPARLTRGGRTSK